MRIANEHVGRLLEARLERIQRATHAPDTARTTSAPPDSATFSALAGEVSLALAAATRAGDSDDPRLSLLAADISAGRYRVSSEAIVDALWRDLRGG